MQKNEVNFKLIQKEDLHIILGFAAKLNSNTKKELLKERLSEMSEQGYECVGIFNDSTLIGMAGLWTQTRFYSGKFMEPDNVYVDTPYRSKGIGDKLMKWIYQLAKSRDCEVIELNCYIENKKGQKFWEDQDFKALGLHYQKKLTP